MTKLRKQRRRKVYQHNVNRKRLRNKIQNVGKVKCAEVEKAWDTHKSVQTNLGEMGLSYDPNKTIKIPNNKQNLRTTMLSNAGEWEEEVVIKAPTKTFVAEALAKDARAPRKKMFRLPKGQVDWLTYLMDKYDRDYKAMSRDSRNYKQETWKQLRAKIRKFKKIPEQYSVYLEEKNKSDSGPSEDELTDNEL